MNFPSMTYFAKPIASLIAGLAGLLASGTSNADNDPYGWRGFYVGATGTYGIINQDIKFTAPNVVSGSTDLSGLGITGLVGYRIPLGSNQFRIGVEADATVGDNRGTFNNYRFVSDFLVTARVVGGIHVHPDFLWFVSGGVGWMGINSASAAVGAGGIGGGGALTDPRQSKTVMGGVVSTGFEWDMGKAIHLRGEYLYGSFENHRAETDTPLGATISDKTIGTDVHQLRLGLTFSLQNPYDEPHGRGGDIDHDRYSRSPMK
jgi:Outer membrane protein beta-barrel domain